LAGLLWSGRMLRRVFMRKLAANLTRCDTRRTAIGATVLAAVLICTPGCSTGQASGPWYKWPSRVSASQPADSAVASKVTLAPRPAPRRISSEDNPFAITLAPGSPVVVPGVAIKAVQFDVLQVQAPLGEFSRSQKIWDHLDEQAVGIETQMVLQRNGLRLGVGSQESWPPVHAIFQAVSRRIVRTLPASPPNSLSVSLQLNGEPLDQTVFFYRAVGTLSGSSYLGATDVFRITWEFNSDNIEQVVVFITPEVRQEQSGVTFKATPLGVAPVPVFEGKVFDELACRLVVSSGGYIVVGPGADVARVGLLGREFLVMTIDGEPYETILVIVPRVLDLSRPAPAEASKAAPAK
jgi:hypothetical protein